MMIPDDPDDAYELLNQKAAALDTALDAVEAEQAKGRSGYAAVQRAQQIAEVLKEFGRVVAERIAEARRTL